MLDVCVDYVGRDGAADMDEIASRFATQATRPAGARLHRAAGDGGRPAALGGRAILNSANLEDGEAPGSPLRPGRSRWPASTAPRSSACSSTRRARPATSSGRCGSPTASTTSPSSATASSPSDLIFDALTFPLVHRRRRPPPRRHRTPSRPSAASRPSCPACYTTLGVSNVSLRPQAGGPPRAQQRVPARVRRGRPRLRHRARRARSCRSTGSPTSSARSCLDLIYDRAPPTATTRCTDAARACSPTSSADRRSSRRTARGWPVERAAEAPHHRRRPRRPRATTSTRRWPTGIAPLGDHQRRPARRHEGRRRAVRLRRDAAAVRAAVGRDHEGRRRLPRAAHGEGRRRPARAASCWPPSRATCTTSARTSSTSSSPTTATRCTTSASRSPIAEMVDKATRGQGRRHRHERPAREVARSSCARTSRS